VIPRAQNLRVALRRVGLRPTVGTIEAGWRFYRAHGATIRRARVLCLAADALEQRRPRGWHARADRLYGRAARDLGRVVDPGPASQQPASPPPPLAREPAPRAHRLLWLAQGPYRRLWLAIGALATALAAAVVALVLLGCWISPALRGRLFPPDLAARSPWIASSAVPPNPQRGVGPSTRKLDLFFHTEASDHPWIEIDLGAPRTIRSLSVENRRDCCQDRVLPLNFEIFDEARGGWRVVVQRRAGFVVWTRDFAPVRARRVRLRVGGFGILHLKRISLYQW
jgi:hypothetical protein